MTHNPVTMTEAEFAERVGISRITAWRMRRAGKLPHYKIGRNIKYGEKHVEQFLESCERKIENGPRKSNRQ
jgi:excisionase family DNA binding protein